MRQKTVCLARNTSNILSTFQILFLITNFDTSSLLTRILGVAGSTLNNYMVNPKAFNWRGYTGFFWGACAWIIFVWAFFRLPETKDRTFHELDVLFAQKVPARKFASTNVDAFDEHVHVELAAQYAGQNSSRRSSIVQSVANAVRK